MEVQEVSASSPSLSPSIVSSKYKIEYSKETLVIQGFFESSTNGDDAALNQVGFEDLYKGLSVTADEILQKLNELLKNSLPEGIQSLKPEDVTPEATADRIVKGATAFFDIYAKQNPELEGEELLNSFLDEIKKGIDQGYNDAYQTLEGLGAFDFEGVKSGVEETRKLIDEKLKIFEAFKRKELGLDPQDEITTAVADSTKKEVLSQVGGKLLSVA